MIMNSYPFTSLVEYDEHGDPIYDRAVDADFLQQLGIKDRSYGVIMLNNMGDMKVSAGTGLNVVVNPGYCFIRGCYGWYNEAQTLSLDPAVNNDRIDAVVLRLNKSMAVRGIQLEIKKGEEAASPVAPSMQKTGNIWELGLANIRIKKGASSVETQYIEDTRANPIRCGISTPMQEIDTSMLYDQLQDQINKNLELIRRALDETEAGYLQNQIDGLTARCNALQTEINNLPGKVLPVGCVFISMVKISPINLVPNSTWQQLTTEAVLRFADNINTGGADTYQKTYGIGMLDANGAIVRHGVNPARPEEAGLVTTLYADSGWGNADYQSLAFSGLADGPNILSGATHSFLFAGENRAWIKQNHNNLPKYQNLYGWRRLS